MNPAWLALRQLLFGPPHLRWAVLWVGAALCALDLFAGHVAAERSRLEYQAVVGERLGHLAIMPDGRGFDADTASRVAHAARSLPGVALVVPQMTVAGLAASGARAALFVGEGVGAARSRHLPFELPGRTEAPIGIAMSKPQADRLGLATGSELTLAPLTPGPALNAQVVGVFGSAGLNANARALLMPFGMAQELAGTARVERLVVYLSDPAQLDAARARLAATVQALGLNAAVRNWRELSVPYASARRGAGFALGCMALAVVAVVAVVLVCTLTLDGVVRRRELATLRALGMSARSMLIHILAQGLWIAAAGAALGLAASSVLAWVANRVAMSTTPPPGQVQPALLLEPDLTHLSGALAVLAALGLAAALAPALRATRADLGRALAGLGRNGW